MRVEKKGLGGLVQVPKVFGDCFLLSFLQRQACSVWLHSNIVFHLTGSLMCKYVGYLLFHN